MYCMVCGGIVWWGWGCVCGDEQGGSGVWGELTVRQVEGDQLFKGDYAATTKTIHVLCKHQRMLCCVVCSHSHPQPAHPTPTPSQPSYRMGLPRGPNTRKPAAASEEELLMSDFGSKLLHLSWHPQANVIAAAASNSLYLYFQPPGTVGGVGSGPGL